MKKIILLALSCFLVAQANGEILKQIIESDVEVLTNLNTGSFTRAELEKYITAAQEVVVCNEHKLQLNKFVPYVSLPKILGLYITNCAADSYAYNYEKIKLALKGDRFAAEILKDRDILISESTQNRFLLLGCICAGVSVYLGYSIYSGACSYHKELTEKYKNSVIILAVLKEKIESTKYE